jgi:hypothetical protein
MPADPFRRLTQASAAHLEQLMRASPAPPLQALVGLEWRGYNTSWQPRLLGIQKFIKGFFLVDGQVEGYNIPVAQNGPDAPWLHLPTRENPRRYAFYCVTPVNRASRDNLYPEALLLDYGTSNRNADSPAIAKRLRDYLVQPDRANPDLLLGKAYMALGPLRLPSNFFILERLCATTWQPTD